MNIDLKDLRKDINRSVRIALEEDIGPGDITAELIPAEQKATATVITREDCVVCGQAWFDETFEQLGGLDVIEWHVKDGDCVKAGKVLVTLKGNTRRLLTGERTALNFLQLLSGTATTSAQYAELVKGTDTIVLDTRKTIPGLRTAQKYAVAVGGCANHRIGLFDAFLIKENHIEACGGIAEAISKAKALYPEKTIEIEVENLDQLELALKAKANIIMLDNFSTEMLNKAKKLKPEESRFEISGNMDLSKLANIPDKLVDFASVGRLTKDLKAIDLSFKLASC